MKKAVKNTEVWNQSLKKSNAKTSKLRMKLEQTLMAVKMESQAFHGLKPNWTAAPAVVFR